MDWRLRILVACALLGCVGIIGLIKLLAQAPHVDANWRADGGGHIELSSSTDPALVPHIGQVLLAVRGEADADDLAAPPIDALALQRSGRWLITDADRARQQLLHRQLSATLALPNVVLVFAGDSDNERTAVVVQPHPRGAGQLPAIFWLLSYFTLTLCLVAAVQVLAHPSWRNLLYALIAWCQAGNLLFIAVEATLELGLPGPFTALDMPLRMAFDILTAAAMVVAVCLHPRRLPGAQWMVVAGWSVALLLIGLGAGGWLPQLWWWVQMGTTSLGLIALALLTWSYRIEPHPFAIVFRRFGAGIVGSWLLLTMALAVTHRVPGMPQEMAAIASMVWYVLLAGLLLLVPFVAKSQPVMREFLLLAAVSAIATSLDLLFVTLFALGQFASLILSLFISLAVYAAARRWILSHLLGSSMLTTERMFERLYRIAREVEAAPERAPTLLSGLLQELFEPMEVSIVERHAYSTRMASDGSSLLVPVPALGGESERSAGSVLIRFAHRGRRLFTAEDARLTDRIVEQLRRAVAFDKAVEQGRKEERLRLAQDLHDDIGARLLTLMYKAQSPEMEDYVRHTLQDLKTLTRGLAASNHPLSHAAAEWKADLTQRLTAADIALTWNFAADADVLLTVVQWSGLTRVLRELVSNTIAHAQARRLVIDFRLENDQLELVVTDNGLGRAPKSWSHGLGLGGIRKRVKQLGGDVEWREATPNGIACRVVIRQLSGRF
ncbi:hypothetical protein BH11PSE8_BH11PSE8_21380 [soil metagenome]